MTLPAPHCGVEYPHHSAAKSHERRRVERMTLVSGVVGVASVSSMIKETQSRHLARAEAYEWDQRQRTSRDTQLVVCLRRQETFTFFPTQWMLH